MVIVEWDLWYLHVTIAAFLAGISRAVGIALRLIGFDGRAFNFVATETLAIDDE